MTGKPKGSFFDFMKENYTQDYGDLHYGSDDPNQSEAEHREIALWLYKGLEKYFNPKDIHTAADFLDHIKMFGMQSSRMFGPIIMNDMAMPKDKSKNTMIKTVFACTFIMNDVLFKCLKKHPDLLQL